MKYIVALVLIVISACSQKDLQSLTVPGVSKALAEERSERVKNVIYSLKFSLHKDKFVPVQGEMRLRFELSSIDQPLILDFNAPVGNIRGIDSPLLDRIVFKHENEHIIIDPVSLRIGRNDINITFTSGELGLNRMDDYIYTLLVPDRASSVFPSFDQPDIKGTYQLTLEIPEDWNAVTSGALESETIIHSRKTLVFKRSPLFSTYLFSFAAGKFQKITQLINGMEMNLYHRETDSVKVARNATEIFELHWNAIEWMSDYTEAPYVFGKFDFIAIPSFQYGGMEHPGTIHYRANSLFLDETATQNQYLGRASLIAHETAHMWFGNLVTMKWFDDVWMKEVFANFMADKIVNPSFPDIDHDLKFLLSHYPRAYQVDRSMGANAIKQELENLKQAGTMYGAIIYNKAPIMMKKLERIIGEEAFRTGLRQYLVDFGYGNADWGDLIEILDSKTEIDLKTWSDIWISSPGMPVITVKKSDKIVLSQVDPFDDGRIWMQDINLITSNGKMNGYFDDDELRFNLQQPSDYVLPNGGGTEYGSFILDNASISFLLVNIRGISNDYERGVAWLDLYETFLNGKIEAQPYANALLSSLESESNMLVIELLLDQLNTVFWKFLDTNQRLSLASQVEETLWSRLNSGEKDIQAIFFKGFVKMSSSKEGSEKLYGLWSKRMVIDGLTLAENDYTDLSLNLALRDYPESTAILRDQLGNISNEDNKKRFRFIRPSVVTNAKTREQFFYALSQANKREVEPWVLDGLRFINHPLRAEQSAIYVRRSLNLLEEIQLTGDIFFPKRWLDATFSGHTSSEVLATVDQFLEENKQLDDKLRNKVLQSTDELRRIVRYRSSTPQ